MNIKQIFIKLLDLYSSCTLLILIILYNNLKLGESLFIYMLAIPFYAIIKFLRYKIENRKIRYSLKENIFYAIIILATFVISIFAVIELEQYKLTIPLAIGLNWLTSTIIRVLLPYLLDRKPAAM